MPSLQLGRRAGLLDIEPGFQLGDWRVNSGCGGEGELPQLRAAIVCDQQDRGQRWRAGVLTAVSSDCVERLCRATGASRDGVTV